MINKLMQIICCTVLFIFLTLLNIDLITSSESIWNFLDAHFDLKNEITQQILTDFILIIAMVSSIVISIIYVKTIKTITERYINRCKILFMFIFLVVCPVFFTYMYSQKLDITKKVDFEQVEIEVLNKTKEKVLEIAFKNSETIKFEGKNRTPIGMINKRPPNKVFNCDSIDDAKNNSEFMKHNIWGICYSFRKKGEISFLVVEFENNKAIKVKKEIFYNKD